MTDKPLNVRVAEALGWTSVKIDGLLGYPWRGVEYPGALRREIPPYGEESPEGWACTGPLISMCDIHIRGDRTEGWHACQGHHPEYGCEPFDHKNLREIYAEDATAPRAVARFVIALAEAGRLPK